MATIAVIGERALVPGWALAGAVVHGADGAAEVHEAWQRLDPGVAVVVLTPAAASHLTAEREGDWPLTVVMPP